MSQVEKIRVEIVYARADRQVVVALDVDAGTTLFDAVLLSHIAEQFPGEIDPETAVMGIFAKIERWPKTRVLGKGDRVEIYRPLLVDPNDLRKSRAQKITRQRTPRNPD